MLPLRSDQTFSRAYFNKSSYSTRNYLFINTDTSEKTWLFDHTDYLIQSVDRLRHEGIDSKRPTAAILYTLVKIDSDQNSRLTAADLSTVAVTKTDGSNYKELINDIELIIDHELINEKELLLIYQKKGISYSLTLDLEKLEIIKNEKLPNVALKQARKN